MSDRIAAVIFAALGLGTLGLTLLFAYETWSLATDRGPTLSSLTAEQIALHPHWSVVSAVVLGIVIGALVTHFSHWTPA